MVEHVLRGVLLVALAVMLWMSLHPPVNIDGSAIDAHGITTSDLANWSRAPLAPKRINVRFDSIPSRVQRVWLGALAGAGSMVSWNGELIPIMAQLEPVARPGGGARVRVAAPVGTSAIISDDVGAVDTAQIANGGGTLTLASNARSIVARANGSAASAAMGDSVLLRKVLVIGAAGWESKFTAAALEEEGWKVDVLARVAPAVEITSGAAASIDTSRYSAVIALDATAEPYAARLTEFVRSGGGLIVAPGAATSSAVAPLQAVGPEAVVLEKRGATPTVAARRFGAGRLLQVGYEDTWRARMTGGDSAVTKHRRLWTRLVSDVAYAPRVRGVTDASANPAMLRDDVAPMAELTASVRLRSSGNASAITGRGRIDWTVLLFVILSLTLMGEVASRRFRGAA